MMITRQQLATDKSPYINQQLNTFFDTNPQGVPQRNINRGIAQTVHNQYENAGPFKAISGYQTSSQFGLTNRYSQGSKQVMHVRLKKRIKMSPREAALRTSSCDPPQSQQQDPLHEESHLTLKVLLRHQNNKTTMDWNRENRGVSIDSDIGEDQESIFVKDSDKSEFSTIFNARLLRIRKDDKGKPLKRSMLGSVEDFIESYRKKSPQTGTASRVNARKSMKSERLPQLRGQSMESNVPALKPQLAFIPSTEYIEGGGDQKPKIKVPKVSSINLKVLSKQSNTAFPLTTQQTEDEIEKGESSQLITGCFEQVKEAEEFKRAQKAYLRHQASLEGWVQTSHRLKERLKTKNQSLLLEKQKIDPDARIKDYEALIKYQSGNAHEQNKKYRSSLRGASITYTHQSNNPYSMLWAIEKPAENLQYINPQFKKESHSRFGRITKYTESLRDFEKSNLQQSSRDHNTSTVSNQLANLSMISSITKFNNNY